MAARRVTKSAVDWAKFASLVPKNQTDCYKAFKSKSDMFLAKYDMWEHDHIASDLFNIHVVTEFSRDVIILTYNGCVLKLNR